MLQNNIFQNNIIFLHLLVITNTWPWNESLFGPLLKPRYKSYIQSLVLLHFSQKVLEHSRLKLILSIWNSLFLLSTGVHNAKIGQSVAEEKTKSRNLNKGLKSFPCTRTLVRTLYWIYETWICGLTLEYS